MEPLTVIATAAAAATESTAAALPAAAAATGAMEAALPAAAVEMAAPVAETAQGLVETALVPNPLAAKEVMALANRAAGASNIADATNAVRGLADLHDIASGRVVNEAVAAPKAPGLDVPEVKLNTEQEVAAKTKTETSLRTWEQENPKPDPSTNPEAYQKWCENREAAEVNYITETKTELVMRDWDSDHPEPADKTSGKHKEWEMRRSQFENSQKEKIRLQTERLKMSERELVLVEINRLREAYSARYDINQAIKTLHDKKETLSDEEKVNLGVLQNRKILLTTEIQALEADLKQRSHLSSPAVALMITSALASMSIYKIGQQEHVF